MKIITDLHIHSGYSRGCSKQLTLENIAKWCRYKGIDIVSTGDFTHPAWFKSLKNELKSTNNGFYELKSQSEKVKFVIGTEISCIYTQGGKCRRIHVCVLAPSIETAEKLIVQLQKRGCNLRSDGRPIIGLSAKALAQLCWDIDQDFFIFPAHAWTPWFAIFGSKSGFDSIAECFEELADKISALETGLSSNPTMNHQVSMLDKIALLSNSDAHSLTSLGREANIFYFNPSEFNYQNLIRSIKKNDRKRFLATIEFFPEEGKYFLDGHADCKYSCLPNVSITNNNLCKKCHKPMTLGVLNRVNELADRTNIEEKIFRPHYNIIPLQEIIAQVFKVGKNSKKVLTEYLRLVEGNSEFSILLDLTETELKSLTTAKIAKNIINMRSGQVRIKGGYDGVYGEVSIGK